MIIILDRETREIKDSEGKITGIYNHKSKSYIIQYERAEDGTVLKYSDAAGNWYDEKVMGFPFPYGEILQTHNEVFRTYNFTPKDEGIKKLFKFDSTTRMFDFVKSKTKRFKLGELVETSLIYNGVLYRVNNMTELVLKFSGYLNMKPENLEEFNLVCSRISFDGITRSKPKII